MSSQALEQLEALAEKLDNISSTLQTEEAAKTALVLPFLRALGFDVFDPQEVTPEYTVDVGVKRGEKVDYAVLQDGEPIILLECKPLGSKLERYGSQLFRYYSASTARIGVLTDGQHYLLYADLVRPNILDDDPFLRIDLRQLSGTPKEHLELLTKDGFDSDRLVGLANALSEKSRVRDVLREQMNSPTDDLVRVIGASIVDGRFTRGTLDHLRDVISSEWEALVSQRVETRLMSALATNRGEVHTPDAESPEEDETEETTEEEEGVVTTMEELEGFYCVKAVLRGEVDPGRIAARDVRSYFGILLDDNNRKPICRLWFNGRQKYLGVFDAEKRERRIAIEAIHDIFNLAEEIKSSLAHALGKAGGSEPVEPPAEV